MRMAYIFAGLFILVVADITANHGAAVHGWMAFLASIARNFGFA